MRCVSMVRRQDKQVVVTIPHLPQRQTHQSQLLAGCFLSEFIIEWPSTIGKQN